MSSKLTENAPNNNGYISLPNADSSTNVLSHEYDRLMSLKPTRPAPKLPPSYPSSNYSTLNSFQGKIKVSFNYNMFFLYKSVSPGLEGIPFILNQNISTENKLIFEVIYEIV